MASFYSFDRINLIVGHDNIFKSFSVQSVKLFFKQRLFKRLSTTGKILIVRHLFIPFVDLQKVLYSSPLLNNPSIHPSHQSNFTFCVQVAELTCPRRKPIHSSSSTWVISRMLQREEPRRNPNQMPDPPQETPRDAEELCLCSELPRLNEAPHFISEADPSHPQKLIQLLVLANAETITVFNMLTKKVKSDTNKEIGVKIESRRLTFEPELLKERGSCLVLLPFCLNQVPHVQYFFSCSSDWTNSCLI